MLLIGIRQQGQWQVLGANGRLFVWLTMSADRAQSPSWHTHTSRDFTPGRTQNMNKEDTQTREDVELLSVSSNVWISFQKINMGKMATVSSYNIMDLTYIPAFWSQKSTFSRCSFMDMMWKKTFCVSRALVDSVWMNECKGNTEVSPALLRLPQRQKK